MAFGLKVYDENGNVTLDSSTTKFTRFKGKFTVSIPATGFVYFEPPEYLEGDIIVPYNTSAPFLRVDYETTRIKLTPQEGFSGNVEVILIGFI